MRFQLLGVRGSTAAPGADFVRYGGHTSCVAVSPDGGDVPTLVLDAGTGMRALTALLGGDARSTGSIVLSHLHWDHMQGLPFFAAGDRPDARVDLYVPAQGGRSRPRPARRRHSRRRAFPITRRACTARWSVPRARGRRPLHRGLQRRAADVAHKGGRTFGYRVSRRHGSVAYLPDHAPAAGVSDDCSSRSTVSTCSLHDAQFVEPERAMAATTATPRSRTHRAGAQVTARHPRALPPLAGATDDALDAINA